MSSPCLRYRCSRTTGKAFYWELYLTLRQYVVAPFPEHPSRSRHSPHHPHKVSSYSYSLLMACFIDRPYFSDLSHEISSDASYIFHLLRLIEWYGIIQWSIRTTRPFYPSGCNISVLTCQILSNEETVSGGARRQRCRDRLWHHALRALPNNLALLLLSWVIGIYTKIQKFGMPHSHFKNFFNFGNCLTVFHEWISFWIVTYFSQ